MIQAIVKLRFTIGVLALIALVSLHFTRFVGARTGFHPVLKVFLLWQSRSKNRFIYKIVAYLTFTIVYLMFRFYHNGRKKQSVF